MIPTLILAAGKGSRLGDLTKDIPKPMLDIAGKPCLERIVDYLNHYDITKIIMNVHYKPEIIANYFGNKLYYFYEPQLLGEFTTVNLIHNLLNCHTLMVVNGDTLTNCDLNAMIESHYQEGKRVTRFTVSGIYAGIKLIRCYSSEDREENYTQKDGWFIDIGTVEGLQKARNYFKGK